MSQLAVRLLGPLQVTLGSEPVTAFSSDKVRALLVYLAVECERPHPRESLLGLLWPDYPQRSARVNLRSALANLRSAIGDREAMPPYLDISRQTLQFNRASNAWVDVTAFCDLLHKEVSEQDAIRRLVKAIELYQGVFLEGFSLPDSPAFEQWALLERERLHRLVSDALRRLADYYEEHGQYDKALQRARHLLELDPLLEAEHRRAMRLLAMSGQRAAAVAQYDACRLVLAQELGVEPELQTRAVYQKIVAEEIAPLGAAVTRAPHNLPAQLTPFVGREAALAEIGERLEDPTCRLLTLVGPGGCGKTRLALKAAVDRLGQFGHGVFFVSLATLGSADDVPTAVAEALGFVVYEGAGLLQQLLGYLGRRQMLLVMDNYEHVLEGAGLVTEILRAAPKVQVLVTSRARLNVEGEYRYQVKGMHYPDPARPVLEREEASQPVLRAKEATHYSAIKLFLQGARRAQSGFKLTEENLGGVVNICQLVEGLPLAIQLAASWVAMLSPQEIASELARSLDLLATERRDVPARQRSMRATLDHTWRLLTERQRDLLQGLSVFRGGFTRQAAREVTGASLQDLMALADRSLLQLSLPGRYDVHELPRQYAQEKLDASPCAATAAYDRHCAYFCSALERWGEDLKGPRQLQAVAEMRADRVNIRLAWDWAVSHARVAQLHQAVDALGWFYDRYDQNLQEAETWFGSAAKALAPQKTAVSRESSDGTAVLERAAPSTLERRARTKAERLRLMARLLTWQAYFAVLRRPWEVARELLQRSQDLLDDPALAEKDTRAERAWILTVMGYATNDREHARRLQEQSLALYEALSDRFMTGAVLQRLGLTLGLSEGYDEFVRRMEEGLALRRKLGDHHGLGNMLYSLSRSKIS